MSLETGKRKLTYDDFARIPADGYRHEIIDGEHCVNPAPIPAHQYVSRHLQFALFDLFERSGRGQVINAPIDVQLGEHDIVEPDLVLVRAERAHIITQTRIIGVPDLLIEILSPGTRKHDRERKRVLYERAGVPEYWIVDPDAHAIEQLVLRDGQYHRVPVVGDRVTAHTIADLAVHVPAIWPR